MDYFFIILPYLLDGFLITALVLVVTSLTSLPLGLLGAVLRFYAPQMIRILIDGYTAIIRGTPLLLQLFFVMYGLPMFGIVLDRIVVALLTFTVNYSAYYIEIFRGTISSIDPTQFDAANSLQLSKWQTMRAIILPQTLKRSLSVITNETITLLKDTALVSSIAVADMLRNAREIVARDLQIEAFIIVATIYLLTTYILIAIFKLFEKKLGYYH